MLTILKAQDGQLAKPLRGLVTLTAFINIAVGLAFTFGPEIKIPDFMWPSPIPPVLMRFIRAIILGNGVGAWLVARWGDWRSARVLFIVAFTYGLVVLIALLYHLAAGGLHAIFTGYLIVDAIFLFPIGYAILANRDA
jgi:hypothetical protein